MSSKFSKIDGKSNGEPKKCHSLYWQFIHPFQTSQGTLVNIGWSFTKMNRQQHEDQSGKVSFWKHRAFILGLKTHSRWLHPWKRPTQSSGKSWNPSFKGWNQIGNQTFCGVIQFLQNIGKGICKTICTPQQGNKEGLLIPERTNNWWSIGSLSNPEEDPLFRTCNDKFKKWLWTNQLEHQTLRVAWEPF